MHTNPPADCAALQAPSACSLNLEAVLLRWRDFRLYGGNSGERGNWKSDPEQRRDRPQSQAPEPQPQGGGRTSLSGTQHTTDETRQAGNSPTVTPHSSPVYVYPSR